MGRLKPHRSLFSFLILAALTQSVLTICHVPAASASTISKENQCRALFEPTGASWRSLAKTKFSELQRSWQLEVIARTRPSKTEKLGPWHQQVIEKARHALDEAQVPYTVIHSRDGDGPNRDILLITPSRHSSLGILATNIHREFMGRLFFDPLGTTGQAYYSHVDHAISLSTREIFFTEVDDTAAHELVHITENIAARNGRPSPFNVILLTETELQPVEEVLAYAYQIQYLSNQISEASANGNLRRVKLLRQRLGTSAATGLQHAKTSRKRLVFAANAISLLRTQIERQKLNATEATNGIGVEVYNFEFAGSAKVMFFLEGVRGVIHFSDRTNPELLKLASQPKPEFNLEFLKGLEQHLLEVAEKVDPTIDMFRILEQTVYRTSREDFPGKAAKRSADLISVINENGQFTLDFNGLMPTSAHRSRLSR